MDIYTNRILDTPHSPVISVENSGLFLFPLAFLHGSGAWILPNKHSFSVFLV